MINLGNGRIYLQKDELVPLGCPECGSPVPYQTEEMVTCIECGFTDEQDAFNDVVWKFGTIN